MANDWLRIRFLFTEQFDSDFVGDLLNYCLDFGCSTQSDGSTDICAYRGPNGNREQDVSTTEVIDELSQHRKGRMELWYHDLRISLKINPNDQNILDSIPLVSIGIMNSQFKQYDKYPEEEVQGRVNQLIEFVVALAEFADPAFTYATTEAADRPLDLTWTDLVDGRPPARLHWLSIFSEQMVDRFGRDRLENAPAWKVRELETGGVLLVVSNNPVHPDPELPGSYSAVAKHLGRPSEPS